MRLPRVNQLSCLGAFAVLALAGVLAGCGTKPPQPSNQPDPQPGSQADATNVTGLTGIFRVNDRLKIDITGIPETMDAIETSIKDDGTVSIPLIGRVQAAGLTTGQLEKEIQTALVPRFYTHCNVVVTATGQFFYVIGEVMASGSGGRIALGSPITVTRAIAAAGGFSPFANKKDVLLTRVNGTQIHVNCRKAALHPEQDPQVYPGDSIYIRRRF
jgi:protein involved in polysaccharide export with SLBB domain